MWRLLGISVRHINIPGFKKTADTFVTVKNISKTPIKVYYMVMFVN